MAHHNKLHDGVANLASKALTHMHVHDEPKIYIGCTMHQGKKNLKESPLKD